MDSQNLRAFLAVAESGSFSAAAQALHLTQPAVSKRIASLEAQLDCKLFDRISRQITLTEAGQTLLARARAILNAIDDTRKALGNLSEKVSGSLTMATSHHIGLHRLPAVLKTYSKRYPDVRLDIRFIDSEQAYTALSQGEIELGIITLSPDNQPPVIARRLWQDPLAFVVAPEHPLTEKPTINLKDLSHFQSIFPDNRTFTHHIVKALFDQAGLTLDISMSTNYLETIKMMVSIGLAWSVLPETMLDGTTVRLPVEGANLSRTLGVIHHSERTLSNAGHAMLALLEELEQP